MSTLTEPRPLLQISLARGDQHWWMTILGVLALAIAAAMAMFGLPPVDLHSPLHKIGIMDPSVAAPGPPGTPRRATSRRPGDTTLSASSSCTAPG